MIRSLSLSLLVLISLSATSCLQPPSKTDDNGPVVPVSEVQAAILQAWGDADFSSVAKNEFLYIEQEQKISNLDPVPVYKEGTTVVKRDVSPETIDYSMVIQSQAVKNGRWEQATTMVDDFSIANTTAELSVPNKSPEGSGLPLSIEGLQKSMQSGTVGLMSGESRNHFLGVVAVQNMLLACVKGEGWDVTCHNLQVTEGVRSPPMRVMEKPNCGGIPNCEIRTKKVSFELVINLPAEGDQDARTEKVIYDMTFSPDVPYLSRLMDFCYQGMIPTSAQKVLIKICNRVQNFEPGGEN